LLAVAKDARVGHLFAISGARVDKHLPPARPIDTDYPRA
jgi:hypothetical protein